MAGLTADPSSLRFDAASGADFTDDWVDSVDKACDEVDDKGFEDESFA
jgi:hypothetical protein